ncbi:FecR family protein [Daejeonella sp.]|uniref:FecR family protein n=1 Tax=Daejeonella sp. TaxID=2805397 RepID=UPI0030BDE351
MSQEKLDQLLILFAEGSISMEDYDQLIRYIRENQQGSNLTTAIDHVFQNMKNHDVLSPEEKELIYQNIIDDKRFSLEDANEDGATPTLITGMWKQLGIAASILLILSTGLYFYTNRSPNLKIVKQIDSPQQRIILPGGDKAVLTLSDGSRIILDNAKNGILAKQAGVSIQKTSDGMLLYSFATTGSEKISVKEEIKIVYNKIETPKGGKYQLNLPDGSKVWLNASSSLRFPALFAGNSREVELTGEAFFDVAENKRKPFKVITKDQIVEVLGTQFNINSYSDEGVIKTTLIEGSVKIIYKDKVVMLGPGQQFQPVNSAAKVVEADTEEVVAWKNGYFLFKNEDIRSIMRKVSRWYDVEVSYEKDIPVVGFGGNISRSNNISEVLNALQLTNAVHFKVEGRRVTVMP